jgi:toxin ParE1/3/4
MRSIRLLESAVSEAEEAAGWYESRRAGLGGDFRQEFKFALDRLCKNVLQGKPWPGRLGERGVKRIAMKRFPFFVVFVKVDAALVVLAIAHYRRRPAYWRSRLPEAKSP